MADPVKVQNWFCVVSFDDVYHTHLLVIQGTLSEAMAKLRASTQLHGSVIHVFALEACDIPPNSAKVFGEMLSLGGLMRRVATLRYDGDFERWKQAFGHILEELSIEQQEAELKSLGQRVLQELKAIEVRKTV